MAIPGDETPGAVESDGVGGPGKEVAHSGGGGGSGEEVATSKDDQEDVEMSDVGAGAGAVDQEEKVMADSGVAATVSVSLHPLVIMNISEHWTRSVLSPPTL